MKDQRDFWSLLRVVSPPADRKVQRLEDLHKMPVSDADTPEENLVLMISKLIYMAETLPICIKTGDETAIDSCRTLSDEIRRHERLATSGLVEQASVMGKYIFKIVARFPGLMERISIMLSNILDSSLIKAASEIQFSKEAQEEISQICRVTADMLRNLRDTLVIPNKFVLGQIKFDGPKLEHLVEEARLANWERMEHRVCTAYGASVYVEILDSFKNVNEYISRMSESFLELARLESESKD
jgi:Na+/phosphate symporter